MPYSLTYSLRLFTILLLASVWASVLPFDLSLHIMSYKLDSRNTSVGPLANNSGSVSLEACFRSEIFYNLYECRKRRPLIC